MRVDGLFVRVCVRERGGVGVCVCVKEKEREIKK